MNTNNPREYVTLISGEEENFSHVDNTMSPQTFNHYGSTTKYSKVGISSVFSYCYMGTFFGESPLRA